MDGPYDILLTQIYFFSSSKGGPLVNWIPTKDRFYLIGIVSGSFFDCSNILPGIFVQVDEISVLNFLRKEIFGDEPIQLGAYYTIYDIIHNISHVRAILIIDNFKHLV